MLQRVVDHFVGTRRYDVKLIRDLPFRTYAKIFGKLISLTPFYLLNLSGAHI